MSNLVAQPKSRIEIIDYANLIRKIARVEEGFIDIAKVIEHQAFDIFGIDLDIVEDGSREIDRDEYAKFIPDSNTIVARQSVYDGALKRNGIDRFTLAHELGHALFHQKQGLSRSIMKPPAYKDPEWQANEFASHVLCPLKEIKSMRVTDVPDKYGVSAQVACIQFNKLRRMG